MPFYLLPQVVYMYPGAPVGPPEHTEIYDTGSGLGLNYGGAMRARTAQMFVLLNDRTEANLALAIAERKELQMNFPLLLLCGSEDGAVPHGRMADLLAASASGDKEFVTLPGKSHQPIAMKEEGWQKDVQRIIEWIRARS